MKKHKHIYLDSICLTCMISKVRSFIDFDPPIEYINLANEATDKMLADMESKWAIEDELEREWLDNALISLTTTTYLESSDSPKDKND